MNDLPAVLVGVIPWVLVVGLVYCILRMLSPHDRQQGRHPASDGQSPPVRHSSPLKTHLRGRRLVPRLRSTSQEKSCKPLFLPRLSRSEWIG
jgi:hypothetical protein